jgi:hypothetical protein
MSGGDVQDTLNELERKLRELQAELTTPAPSEPAAPGAGPPPMPPYRAPVPQAPPQPPPPPPSGLQDQLDELLRFRDQLSSAASKLVEDYSRIIEQISRVTADATAPPAPAPPPPTPAAGHATFPVPPPAVPSAESTLFSGHVAIHAGPFEDIGTLAQFEQALRAVPHAEEVAVRKLKDQRAVVDLQLAAEVPLVFELRRASERTFDVDQVGEGRLDLTVHTGDLPFPMRP